MTKYLVYYVPRAVAEVTHTVSQSPEGGCGEPVEPFVASDGSRWMIPESIADSEEVRGLISAFQDSGVYHNWGRGDSTLVGSTVTWNNRRYEMRDTLHGDLCVRSLWEVPKK